MGNQSPRSSHQKTLNPFAVMKIRVGNRVLVPSGFFPIPRIYGMNIPDAQLEPKSADQSEPEATVHPQVTLENNRALWRALPGVPRRPEPDIATPAEVSTQSSTRTLTAAKKRS
jgi:hypothetical protein